MIFIGTERIIKDILEEHIETLQFLWEIRCTKLRSPEMSVGAFADLEERISAHTDALVLAGSDAIPLLTQALDKNEEFLSLVAGHCLLCLEDSQAANFVLEELTAASGSRLVELAEALSFGPINSLASDLQNIVESYPLPVAAAAAQALAFHGNTVAVKKRMVDLLNSDQAEVRKSAWKIAAIPGCLPDTTPDQVSVSFKTYELGLQDLDPEVRNQALETAAWNRQPWLLDYCRNAAKNPLPECLAIIQILACLGKPSDLGLLLTAGKTPTLGLSRFKVLASFGHPDVVALLLEGIQDQDPSIAVAAALAFTKITGTDINSGKRTKLPSRDGIVQDDFEEEFIEELELPDPQAANAFWKSKMQIFSKSSRWCYGFDVSNGTTTQILKQIDLESCYEACLRQKFDGTWQGNIRDFAAFPQKLG